MRLPQWLQKFSERLVRPIVRDFDVYQRNQERQITRSLNTRESLMDILGDLD